MYLDDDNHAGGIVGLILGIVYIVIGIILTFSRNPESQSRVPFWRVASGATICLIGIISVVVSIYLCAQPPTTYNPCDSLVRFGNFPIEATYGAVVQSSRYKVVDIISHKLVYMDGQTPSINRSVVGTTLELVKIKYCSKTNEIRQANDARQFTDLSNFILDNDTIFLDGVRVKNSSHVFVLVLAGHQSQPGTYIDLIYHIMLRPGGDIKNHLGSCVQSKTVVRKHTNATDRLVISNVFQGDGKQVVVSVQNQSLAFDLVYGVGDKS